MCVFLCMCDWIMTWLKVDSRASDSKIEKKRKKSKDMAWFFSRDPEELLQVTQHVRASQSLCWDGVVGAGNFNASCILGAASWDFELPVDASIGRVFHRVAFCSYIMTCSSSQHFCNRSLIWTLPKDWTYSITTTIINNNPIADLGRSRFRPCKFSTRIIIRRSSKFNCIEYSLFTVLPIIKLKSMGSEYSHCHCDSQFVSYTILKPRWHSTFITLLNG